MSQAKRSISEFVEYPLERLRIEMEVPVDLWLFFPKNEHLMLWLKSGFTPSDLFLGKYRSRGLQSIWIAKEDQSAFDTYLNLLAPTSGSSEAYSPPPTESPQIQVESTPEEPSPAPSPTVTDKMLEIMNNSNIEEKRKAAMLAKTARSVLQDSVSAPTIEIQAQAHLDARKVVIDLIDQIAHGSQDFLKEIWETAHLDPQLTHGVNVATYAVMLSMAFGHVDQSIITDLACAGLLHDLGITQIPTSIAAKPWSQHTPEERQTYSRHVVATLELVDRLCPHTSERARLLIHHHHEQFNGGGYPDRLEGFKIDGLSQILSIAEVLDTIASGLWDGTQRTYQQALETLEGIEKKKNFPEYFNPEVLAAVLRWARSSGARDIIQKTAEQVKDQAKNLLSA